jgi:hypothetical protein
MISETYHNKIGVYVVPNEGRELDQKGPPN